MSENISLKTINRLAIPSILAGIIEPVISISDTAIVGHVSLNPTESLAAVGIVGSFLSAIIWIFAQTKSSISSIVSQELGRAQLKTIKTLIPQTILLNATVGLLFSGLSFWLAKEIFMLYSAKGIILDYAVSYYKIRVFGLIFTLITFLIFGVFRGLQNTLWAMKISLVGGVLNIVLDYILVYGVGNIIPPMHIQGAAWASLTAQFVMMLLAIGYYLKKTPFGLKLRTSLNSKIYYFLSLTGNLIIRTIALNVAIYLSNKYATSYGKDYIAAHVIATNIWLFSAFFIDGYANAGNSISGRLFGARDFINMKLRTKKLIKYALFVALLLSIVYVVSYPFIGEIFTRDLGVLNTFDTFFWLVILMQPVGAIAFIFDGIFKGIGWAKYLRNIQLAATFLVFVPVLLILDCYGYKLHAVWAAFVLWMSFRATGLWIRFNRI